ncbi:MAG: NAD(P)-binding domain-containing protein [Woeseiaceae bacterium]|nr:NAD(P)-binding domain-containing protein [Woeseiaceae bacterium]
MAADTAIAILGTGDMGRAFGLRLAGLGYRVIYGSRAPESDGVRELVAATGHGATATHSADAARAADVVVVALPWQPIDALLDELGDLPGKIVIDLTWPENVVDDDGYDRIVADVSAAEKIQRRLAGARVVKAFGTTGSNVVLDPRVAGGTVSIPIASDHRGAKERVAGLAVELGFDPVDAGPLRMARNIEAMMELYMVPLFQGRDISWEFHFRRTDHWARAPYSGGEVGDERPPAVDAGDLAEFPPN